MARRNVMAEFLRYIEAHDGEVRVEQAAEALGVTSRTLRNQCHRMYSTSPKRLLMDRRLQRVRASLMHPTVTTNVTRVALAYGFENLGRFAVNYRNLFGETPKETLRRARV
jgi:methylphosphotriester-DNA--protein-cysteine methyltransferase